MRSAALRAALTALVALVPSVSSFAAEPPTTVVFSGSVTAPLLVVQDRDGGSFVVAATQDRYVRGWTWDGELRWEFNARRRIANLLNAPDGSIVGVTRRGEILRLSPHGEFASRTRPIPSLATGEIHIDRRGNVRSASGGTLSAVGAAGAVLWRTEFPAEVSELVASDELTWYRTTSGDLFWVSADAAGARSTRRAGVAGMVAAPGEGVALSDRVGALVVTDTSNGNEWRGSGERNLVPLVSSDWGFIGRGSDGSVHVYDWNGNVFGAALGTAASDDLLLMDNVGGAVVVTANSVLRVDAVGAREVLGLPAALFDGAGPLADSDTVAVASAVLSPDGARVVVVDATWRALFAHLSDERFPVPRSPRPAHRRDDESGTRSAFLAVAETVLSAEGEVQRRQLLDQLDRRVSEGRLFGTLADVTTVLSRLAMEPYRHPLQRGGVVVNDYPAVRIGAVRILAAFLDDPSRAALVECARREPDVRVVAAALEALATYGYDETRSIVRIAADRFSRATPAERRLLGPYVVAAASMAGTGVEGTRLLEEIATADVGRSTRREALRAMRSRQQ